MSVFDNFGINVFTDDVMKARISNKAYLEYKESVESDKELSLEAADEIANAMKEWAIEKGATHYSHWFQPMTGITAEKQDAFISLDKEGKVITEFCGKELVRGEPDASSFPSGGLRATFEARGYTAWDCTSPAFIRKDDGGKTLCIPTAFCSYTAEALDKKTPLLRSMEAINKQCLRILRLFGNTTVKKVNAVVGPEQEYFLIDKDLYNQREDLIFSGRTLFGAKPPKGQELDDHYFGIIKERVASFMREVNLELWELGVTAKTQHNEAAPAQHELAPIYATVNIAADHNQIIMETLKRVAQRHNLACLLNEKPFMGVNGSGKHNNWSLVTDEGQNLFDPGKTPHENVQFLLFLVAVLRAVDLHADLLRYSAANPGNDHRLGAAEAPPAIISVYLGETLENVLTQIEQNDVLFSKKSDMFKVGVSSLPTFKKDDTDRNRTSPFAFTGNKFEFRMVPSSASISGPNVILNTAVADVLCGFADELENKEDLNKAVWELIRKYSKEHKRIIFNGNGYSQEWKKEAEKRGLLNITNTVDAIDVICSEKAVKMFSYHKVFSKSELNARSMIKYEKYIKTINIEARTMIDMASKQIIPSVIEYSMMLAKSIINVKSALKTDAKFVTQDILKEIMELLDEAKVAVDVLKDVLDYAEERNEGPKELAIYYRDKVCVAMDRLRKPCDRLEMLVGEDYWPIPTYSKLLFGV